MTASEFDDRIACQISGICRKKTFPESPAINRVGQLNPKKFTAHPVSSFLAPSDFSSCYRYSTGKKCMTPSLYFKFFFCSIAYLNLRKLQLPT